MKRVILVRNNQSDLGSFGKVFIEGVYFCYSCEDAWKDNKPNISCIPTGIYQVEMTYSNRFKRHMYQIMNVPNRFGIRIHSGNTPQDVEGCILLGKNLGWINGVKAVLSSKVALTEFHKILNNESFELTILEV